MNSLIATMGPSGDFRATSEGILRALDADVRVMRWAYVDTPLSRPICLDGYKSQTLTFIGANQLGCNLQRAFEGGESCVYAHNSEWRFHCSGVNFLGNPHADDKLTPLVSLSYLDRSSFRDMGVYGGTIALGLSATGSLGNGYCSQTVFDHVEGHRSPRSAWDIFGFRKLTFQGECSFERNGLDAPELYPGLNLVGDPKTLDRGQSIVTGCRLEHDDDRHFGIRIRDAGGMLVGYNRLMRAGVDAECYASSWAPDTVYGRARNTRTQLPGKINRWLGRGVRLGGPAWNRHLEWEPEAEFDLRLP